MSEATGTQAGSPADARVAALEAEVARLRARIADEQFADDLRARLAQVGATGLLGAPTEQHDLLEQVVQTAMAVIHARAGSLYLADEAADALVFEVALGEKAEPLRGQRLQLGRGISGWVAVTGQAIALADVRRDERWAEEIGYAIGYTPKTMLAVPLVVRDDVIGVLQLLDKETDEPFDTVDMHTLGMFAQQAGVAIAQSERVRSLSALLRAQLAAFAGLGDLAGRGATFTERTERSSEYLEIARLAELLGQLIRRGEAERRLGLEIVGAITAYVARSGRSAA